MFVNVPKWVEPLTSVKPRAFSTTLNLLSNTVFSVDLVRSDSETTKEIKAAVWGLMKEAGKPNLSDYFPLLRPFDPQGIRRRVSVYLGKLHKLFDELIDLRLNSRASLSSPSTRNNDLLDVLLDQENTSEFGRPDIKSLLTDIFAAGTETTSTTLEWAMAELLHNPDLMAKVQLELRENLVEGKPVEEADVARLPYLQAILQSFSQISHPQDSLSFLHHMTKTHPSFIPNRSTYNILLSQSYKTPLDPDLSSLRKTLDLMTQNGFPPDQSSVDLVVRSFCSVGREDHAVELVKEFSLKNSPPDSFTYNFFIRHLSKIRVLSTIYGLIEDLLNSVNLKPDLVTYHFIR